MAADLVVSFIVDMPAAKVIITAPTNRQVNELLWPHVSERLIHVGMASTEWHIPVKPNWDGGDDDHLIGYATNTPERNQGFHAKNLLIICDETSGMKQKLIEALEGIATGEHNYILAIGNPNQPSGAFFGMTRRASYHTEVISALTHPNILARDEVIPGATSWIAMVDRMRDWCKEVKEPSEETFELEISDYELHQGTDKTERIRWFTPNDAFRVRYLGAFPRSASWSLFPQRKLQQAMDAIMPGDRPRIAALDIARTGGDRTIYGLRGGDEVRSIRVIQPADLMKQAEEVAAILIEDEPESITCDAAGLGIGLIDRLRQLTPVPVVAFQGAAEPLSPLQQRKFLNRRAVAYGNLATAFEQLRISIPKDEELADELAAVTYRHTDDGRMQIGDKEEIKELLGRSPDVADMISLLWERGTDFSWAVGGATVLHVQREEYRW